SSSPRPPRPPPFPYTTLFRSDGLFSLGGLLAILATEIQPSGQLAHDQEVDSLYAISLQRRGVQQVVVTLDRSQVGKQPEAFAYRSEEHTSELQSRENLVCRLL